MAWIYYLVLLALMLVGLFLNIVGLPGLWLIVGVHAAYAYVTGWEHFVGWPSVIALIVLALCAEVVEFMAGAAGSKSAGGRKRGMIGAIIGGLVGAVFFTGLVPIPIVGTIIGVCLGTFVGAAIMEYYGKGAVHSIRVGVGAAKGRFWGIIGKSAFGMIMLVVAVFAAVPMQFGAGTVIPVSVPPTTAPATLPATTPSL
jgi:uncharacterized protein YqgC (DUF456 family)